MSTTFQVVQPVSVGELVAQRRGSTPDRWELALVQRALLWDEVRMARLLDSLLAGYPIGTILLCRVRSGSKVLVDGDDGRRVERADSKVDQLLDGQQRINALATIFGAIGDFGRFYLHMTARRDAGRLVLRRRDRRRQTSYIYWIAEGDAADWEGVARADHMDLSRWAEWAERMGRADRERALAALRANPAVVSDYLNEADPDIADRIPAALQKVAADRFSRLLEIWDELAIPVQRLHLETPDDVLQVFTRINLEGVAVKGEDVFFAAVKTKWPEAEQSMQAVTSRVPLLTRLTALRVLSRIANFVLSASDLVPLRIDSLNGEKGEELIATLQELSRGAAVDRMEVVAQWLTSRSALGYAFRAASPQAIDHVLAWAAMNKRASDPEYVDGQLPAIEGYLAGATAFGYFTVLRDSYARVGMQESVVAGHEENAFPADRIRALLRSSWPHLRQGRRAALAAGSDAEKLQIVGSNPSLFLPVAQQIPYDLPPRRRLEWDHIYPQARANLMRIKEGSAWKRNHSLRHWVWHTGNLWALDAAINRWASARMPSEKFDRMRALPWEDLPSLWPTNGFLTSEMESNLRAAEELLLADRVNEAMPLFERYARSRAMAIWEHVTDLIPSLSKYAADGEAGLADPITPSDIPASMIRKQSVLRSPAAAPEAPGDGVLSVAEIQSITLEYLHDADPEQQGVHYYEILKAAMAQGKVSEGDGAPRINGILHSAPSLFEYRGHGTFTWAAERRRRYWVMRTDQSARAVLWPEVVEGRLRQGWGYSDDQDLRLIATAEETGRRLSESQIAAKRNQRMFASNPNAIQVGDLVILPHLPQSNHWSIAEVTGAYMYSTDQGWSDYRHVLPVRLLTDRKGIFVNDDAISPALRRAVKNRQRLWNIDPVATFVEELASKRPGRAQGKPAATLSTPRGFEGGPE